MKYYVKLQSITPMMPDVYMYEKHGKIWTGGKNEESELNNSAAAGALLEKVVQRYPHFADLFSIITE